MIYFTSDLHLDHTNILKLENRPFRSLDEMVCALRDNWNKTVRDKDTVYVLGDVCLGKSGEAAYDFFSSVKGEKILVKGNHDQFLKDKNYDWNEVFSQISDYIELKYQKTRYVLFHYPIYEWRGHCKKNSIHLHGHIHSSPCDKPLCETFSRQMYDVGVDNNGFRPVSIEYVTQKFIK